MAQSVQSPPVEGKPAESDMMSAALNALGLGNTATQIMLNAWTSYTTLVRDVREFGQEQQRFEQIKKFLDLEGSVLSEVKIDDVLKEKLEQNEEDTWNFIQKYCFNPFSQQTPADPIDHVADQKMEELDNTKKKFEMFTEEFQRLKDQYGDETKIQERADEILTDGRAIELSLLGIAVGFATLWVASHTYSKGQEEMAEIKNDLVRIKQELIDPLMEAYDNNPENPRVSIMKIFRVRADLDHMTRRIKKRIAEAKQQRNSLALNSALNAVNAMSSWYKLFTVGQAASTSVQVLQAVVATGQTAVSVGSGHLALKFHYSIDDWEKLNDRVSTELRWVTEYLENREGSASNCA